MCGQLITVQGRAVRNILPQVAAVVAMASTMVFAQAPAASAAYADADEHYAGSQIARHEGGQSGAEPSASGPEGPRTLGNDVSRWQGDVDWKRTAADGAKFSYVKATEGTGYRNPHFTQQYNGSYDAGMIRGAYHFARPDRSSGAKQANYFVDHGGGWSDDGRTLPGALDVEYNPYGDDPCYGLSKAAMTAWIKAFSDTYTQRTGRAPTIYTSTSWWRLCTGDSAAFGSTNPLWIARYSGSVGELPAGWPTHTIWQYSDKGELPGDQNYFNGDHSRLRVLAAR